MPEIYTLGYSSPNALTDLKSAMKDSKVKLVDTRLQPFSKYFIQWNRNVLELVWGGRYSWIQDLGNINYNNDQAITLKNEVRGLDRLFGLIEKGPVVLLCGCSKWQSCHRHVVASKALLSRPELTAVHLGADTNTILKVVDGRVNQYLSIKAQEGLPRQQELFS